MYNPKTLEITGNLSNFRFDMAKYIFIILILLGIIGITQASSAQTPANPSLTERLSRLQRPHADTDLVLLPDLRRYRLDSAKGHYLRALQMYERYKRLSDSLYNGTQSRQVEQLSVQLETEKKDDELQLKEQNILLLTKQGQLQQARLRQATLLRNVTFSGIALLLVIVGLIYNRYRIKQRSNQLLENLVAEKDQLLREKEGLLEDKEWLLKEVHHRVKNNLQICISLLNIQSASLESDVALTAIRESQQRMYAISLIHQKLYQSENTAFIDMKEYVKELAEYLRESFGKRHPVRYDLQIESILLDVSQAVPLGLILNEAISNSIKHAFPDEYAGTITLSLKISPPSPSDSEDKASYILTIADNGRGLPVAFGPQPFSSSKESFGLRLMQGLARQLGGSFKIENRSGVRIEITFADPKVIRRMRVNKS